MHPNEELLYHHTLGFPKHIELPTFGYCLQYGTHAREEALQDRFGEITLPNFAELYRAQIVEIGVVNNKLNKIVARQPHCENFDIVIVFLPHNGFVKTVWLNHKNDNHKTLDKSKYMRVH